MAITGPYTSPAESIFLAQNVMNATRPLITTEIKEKVDTMFFQLSAGVANLKTVDAVSANINTYNLSEAGTYNNLAPGIVVTPEDLAAGVVQARKLPFGTWEKFIIPIPVNGYVNKITDLEVVTYPASKNIFNKAAIPDANRNMAVGDGLGTLQSSTSSDTSDYIDISAVPVGYTILMRSLSTGKGARRFAVYNSSKVYINGTSQEPQRLSYTKQNTGEVYIRASINYDAIADFQIEVVADAATAPTAYVAFRPLQTYLKSVAGVVMPQFLIGNISLFLPTMPIGSVLPTTVTSKAMILAAGSYLQPDGITQLVLADRSILSYDGTSWIVYASLSEPVVIVNEDIPASKNIFDKSAIPVDNRAHSVNVGLGSLQTSSTSDTSDYIDISSYPVGQVFALKSQLTGKGAIRSAFYTQGKTYISGSSVSGELFSKTKNSSNIYWMRVSMNFSAVEDFQVEADLGSGATAYVPFSKARKIVKTINGAEVGTSTAAATTTTTTVADPLIIMSLNRLDSSTVIADKTINKTSGIVETLVGNSITDFIAVLPSKDYSVWTYYALDRAIAWYDKNKEFVSFSTFSGKKASFVSPATAAFAQLDYAVNSGSVNRYIFTQGKDANVWMSFTKGLTSANKAAGKTYGKILWVFGASVSNTRTDLYEANWPNYAAPLGFAEIQNFSIPGAAFRGTTGSNGAQQVNQAISEGHAAPDFVLFDLGTNDGLNNIGDWQTAINKIENVDVITDLDTLDLTKTYEAALYCFFKIRFLFPNVKLYATTFYQKAKPAELASYRAKPLIDAIKQVSAYANALIMDQYTELGIVAAFETIDTDGLYLRDGQHPNTNGMKLEANFFIRKFFNSMI